MNKARGIAKASWYCTVSSLLLLTATALQANTKITIDWLSQVDSMPSPMPTTAFTNTENAGIPPGLLSGHLRLQAQAQGSYFKLLKDSFKSLQQTQFNIPKLPDIAFDFTQSGNNLIPAVRSLIQTDHPYWEWLIAPGKIWQQADDRGFSRAVFPFALQEKNANCTHNGYILLLLKSTGEAERGFIQIGAETCGYLQFDLASKLNVTFEPRPIPGQNSLITAFEQEKKNQITTHDIDDLVRAVPEIDTKILLRPQSRGSITSGIVLKGKNYRINCDTRYGPEPYCEWLALPSYSTAKSIFAGIALMRMEKKHPGVGNVAMTKVIPECNTKDWEGVSLNHLLNMRTGNYRSRKTDADEGSPKMISFFLAETHADKLNLACNMFPHKAAPGKYFVYHTSDTYLAGVMLNRIYQRLEGKADIYTDWFAEDLWKTLGLSPLLDKTKRSYDQIQQPLTGVGLTYSVDDIIKISRFLFSQLESPQPVLDTTLLANSLQRGAVSLNFPANEPGLTYNSGFWALEVSRTLGCKNPKWIPFMSGYGGITVALISPDLIYYNYADDYQYRWLEIVRELGKHFKLCED